MKIDIIIRCITDETKGYGHLRRCILFAKAAQKKGLTVIFIVNFNAVAIEELTIKKIPHLLIPRFTDKDKESSIIKRIAHEMNSRFVLIDMREFGESISKRLQNGNFKTIIFDDAFSKKVFADYLFNGTIIKKYHKYEKINSKVQLFLGSKYFVTAPQFCLYKKKMAEIRDKKIYSVIVSLGGADPDQLTLFILKSISDLHNIKIIVITGPFFIHNAKLKEFVEKRENITLIHSPKKIWKIFYKGDVVISNAGSTLYEMAIQRIPTMCIPVVKHQIPYAMQFESLGFSINLGYWKNINAIKITKTLSFLLKNKKKRRNMWKAAKNIIDGKGLTRIIEAII